MAVSRKCRIRFTNSTNYKLLLRGWYARRGQTIEVPTSVRHWQDHTTSVAFFEGWPDTATATAGIIVYEMVKADGSSTGKFVEILWAVNYGDCTNNDINVRVTDVGELPSTENGWINKYESLRDTKSHRVEYSISVSQGQEKYLLFGGIGKARATEASFELHKTV